MRSTWISTITFSLVLSSGCLAQQWEIGGVGGYAWDHSSTVRNPANTLSAGFESSAVVGAVFGENRYENIGGEIRYLYRASGPRLSAPGLNISTGGFTNLIHYDLLVHVTRKEDKIRPFFAGGAGIQVFTGPDRIRFHQGQSDFALVSRGSHVEPLISAGGGVKYHPRKHLQLRFDFRVYMSPTPDALVRPLFPTVSNGWIFDFTPTLGISYLF